MGHNTKTPWAIPRIVEPPWRLLLLPTGAYSNTDPQNIKMLWGSAVLWLPCLVLQIQTGIGGLAICWRLKVVHGLQQPAFLRYKSVILAGWRAFVV